ncbi:hypothetical protein K8T06_12985 [bacterium]|nr:hypothetical protein [bacterium]
MQQIAELEQILLRNLREITLISDEIYIKQGFDTGNHRGPYPADLTREEFLAAAALDPSLSQPDTVVTRRSDDTLQAVHYVDAYQSQFNNIIRCLDEAAEFVDDKSFHAYLKSAANCFRNPSPETYQIMMQKWLKAREHPLQLVMVWDETYSDTFLGLKGSMDSAVFVADEMLSLIVQQPVNSCPLFAKTFHFPGNPHNFTDFYTRVYETLSLGGALADMQLRAWNLPDDLVIRQSMGSHQLILRENTFNALENDLLPMIQRIFHLEYNNISHEDFLNGLLWTLTAHELGHNLGCYDEQGKLLELNDTFEELKANIIPLIWVMNQHASYRLTSSQAEAAIAVYLALDLMDCVLAKTVPGRRSYARAAWIQMNRLQEMDAIEMKNNRISINLANMETANRKLLDDIMLIMSCGDYSAAAKYAETYGDPSPHLSP